MQKEVWRVIKGHQDHVVSNMGNVKSLERKRSYWNGKGIMNRTFPESKLKPQKRRGYLKVYVSGKQLSVHRIVAESFIDNPKNKPQVNHINGIKTDNRAENLEWVTCRENILHASKNRLGYSGQLNSQSKLKDTDINRIKILRDGGMSYREIGVLFGVSGTTISRAYRGLTYNYEKSLPS